MKSLNKLIIAVILMIASAITAVNFIISGVNYDTAKPHKVEINRLAAEIESNGFEGIDISDCLYITNVATFGDGFYNADSDYVIREIGGKLYRFDYTLPDNKADIVIAVNIALALFTVLFFGIIFYIRAKIIKPFENMKKLPESLAKGTLATPLKQQKSRYFGEFLWGLDNLRETLELEKARSLELLKDRNTLVLSLSHDIKTPLAAIKLYAAGFKRNIYKDDTARISAADGINSKVDEIGYYVTEIMNSQREDFFTENVVCTDIYLSEPINEISAYYKDKLSALHTEFVVSDYSDCLVYGDKDRIIEVLQNIIENAVKYGDGKEIKIDIGYEENLVLISITNTGCTLFPQDSAHIFESFYRGANSKGVQGSGLGLYISRRLINKMEGEIYTEIRDDKFTAVIALTKP